MILVILLENKKHSTKTNTQHQLIENKNIHGRECLREYRLQNVLVSLSGITSVVIVGEYEQ